jgi:ubiquinone/menaquinone biosynthesis C-methylase UbiE
MDKKDIFYNMIGIERFIYQNADLFEQNRRSVNEYFENLCSANNKKEPLEFIDGILRERSTGKKIEIKDNVIDFTEKDQLSKEWARINKNFINFHKALTAQSIFTSTPIINYINQKTELGLLKNSKIIDVGGGTGQSLCSFFHFPETLEYYLVDPNLRLIHDQFLRIYPKLSYLKIAHILAYAEHLPFKNNFADLVISLSAIDHLNDYKEFIKESYRVLKPSGKVFIYSHLSNAGNKNHNNKRKILSFSFFEQVLRFLYNRKNSIKNANYTYFFKDTHEIESALSETGFSVLNVETFKGYFYIIAQKQ